MKLTKWGDLITGEYLAGKGACEDWCDRFNADFFEGLKLTPENLYLVASKGYYLNFLLYWLFREEHDVSEWELSKLLEASPVSKILDACVLYDNDNIRSYGMIPSITVILDARQYL